MSSLNLPMTMNHYQVVGRVLPNLMIGLKMILMLENRDSVDGKEQVKVIYHDNNLMNSTRAEAYKCKDISGASSPSGKLKCCIPSESKSVAFQCTNPTSYGWLVIVMGLGLPCWRSQVQNPLPAKARGFPSGSSSSHRAYLSYVVCELLHRSRDFTLCAPKG
ncbi:hypothetical protein H5410_050643 [Solanum commersonii]|uniref:Uncharacterized protein n=1 Tax=Solanum commersonii TaxID=4109 RepID=A0A9J5WYI8_SOLCO|nr:hypothetical protein H5410_050643 [Solanum commersonii]